MSDGGFALITFVAGTHVPVRHQAIRPALGAGALHAGIAAVLAAVVGIGIAFAFGTGPWRPAAELKESTLVGSMIKLPTLCGKLITYYPASLVKEALRGRFYWFKASCDCDQIAYLIHTESDGVHAKSADTPERVAAQYDALPGHEPVVENPNGRFVVKEDEENRPRGANALIFAA